MAKCSIGFLGVLLAGTLVACGGDDAADPDGGGSGADAGIDASTDGYSVLIASNWTLAAGSENWWCADVTLTEDLYVSAFRPLAPLGTHHTVVSFGDPAGADRAGYNCDPNNEAATWIYASGVGTGELILPEGVGAYIPAGKQVHINIHLFNVSDGGISGRSGVEIKTLPAAEVVHEAEIFLPGPLDFLIPAGETTSASGDCTLTDTQTLVALFPHMHQLGTHFKAEILRDGGEVETLWDQPYEFESQEFAALPSTELAAGDRIRTTCTWTNTTESLVHFGNSSSEEMCFAILMRYPRLGQAGPANTCTQ